MRCFRLLIGLGFLFFTPFPALAADRALIIGVEAYAAVGGTPGCEADARAMKSFVQTRFGFSESAIKLLINDKATAQAIRAEFQNWLIAGTKPGDRVFFFYAGHGSQVPDDNGDEADKFDETIAPYDAETDGKNQIRDDDFEAWIKQLADRQGVFMFDSCHSGTISRGTPKLKDYAQGGGARYLPRQDQLSGVSRSTGGYVVSSLPRRRDLVADEGFLDKPELARLTGAIVISAAQSDQTAYPVVLPDGSKRGALSYVFEQAQRGNRLPTVLQLKTELAERIASFQRAGNLEGDQKPVIEALGSTALVEKPLFGAIGSGSTAESSTVPIPVPVPGFNISNPASNEKVTIQTGESKSIYRNKEKISYKVTSSMSGYLYLIVFSQGNVATVIFPTRSNPNNTISTEEIFIPTSGEEEIQVQEPFGTDIVVALVSSRKIQFDDKDEFTWNEIFERLKIKEIKDELTRGQRPVATWQAGMVVVETKP